MKRFLSSLLLALTGFAFSTFSYAVPIVSWSISGPGTTLATELSLGEWDLFYDLNNPDPPVFSLQTWTVSAVAPANGDYDFNWSYSGFHAFFRVTAFLETLDGTTLYSGGPQNCCISPSNFFDEIGNYVFSGISSGDTIGFRMGGSNFDSNNRLTGTLTLMQVPEPATLSLLGLGFVGLGASRFKRLKR